MDSLLSLDLIFKLGIYHPLINSRALYKKWTLPSSWKQEKENCYLHFLWIFNSFLSEFVFVFIFLMGFFYLEKHCVEFIYSLLCKLTSFSLVYSLGKSINSLWFFFLQGLSWGGIICASSDLSDGYKKESILNSTYCPNPPLCPSRTQIWR